MGKIATEQEAYNIGNSGSPVTNKGCTKSRAEALGCDVSGNYANNQLVQLSDLSRLSYRVSFSISNASTSDDSVHMLTNGTPNKLPDVYDTMYCFEGIYEDIYQNGISVNDYNGGNRLTVPVGGTYYWYLYDLSKSRWVLLKTLTCKLESGTYYATM